MHDNMAHADEPTSLECIHKSELFPKKTLVTEDEALQVPFPLLCGESVEFLGRTADGVIALSNFRLLIRFKESFINISLGLVESVETRDIFYLNIYCKDATAVRCAFPTNESCQDWFKRILAKTTPVKELSDLFAFAFYAWCSDRSPCPSELETCYQLCQQEDAFKYSFGNDVQRLKFDLKTAWRISYINSDFKECPSYPKCHIVPKDITDEDLKKVASFRAIRRFPSVVWRDQRTGAVLVRCSQPELGWLGWRNTEDENLLKAIPLACALNPGTENVRSMASSLTSESVSSSETSSQDGDSVPKNGEITPETKKMLIIDCRSYGAAFANRAKGGGCECAEYYPGCEIQFMNLANIHSIRKGFTTLRTLSSGGPDQASWLSGLEATKWLHYIGGILRAALVVVGAIKEGRPVLVHCSDGWDRTPQIIALSELLLDPYYRTFEGFQVLVEREWLEFGHKFADRCGNGVNTEDINERSPVFLQWLDCVYQLFKQFPCAFEFNEAFLVKLVQHTYSCLLGTFLCNSVQERIKENVAGRTSSVWSLLKASNKKFYNHLYCPSLEQQVLYPSHHVQNIALWRSVYLSNNSSTTIPEEILTSTDSPSSEGEPPGISNLQKTRSCENLAVAQEYPASPSRRKSDPSITLESHDQAAMFLREPDALHALTVANSNENNQDTLVISNGVNGMEAVVGDSVLSVQPRSWQDKASLCNGHADIETPFDNGNIPIQNGTVDHSDDIIQHNGHLSNGLIDIKSDTDEHNSIDVNGSTNGYFSDSEDDSRTADVSQSSSERTLKSNSSLRCYSAENLISSTDTIVEDDGQHPTKAGSKSSLLENGHVSELPNKLDPVLMDRTLVGKLKALGKGSSISTSTSDISDSHIQPGLSNGVSRELKLQSLRSQAVPLKLTCGGNGLHSKLQPVSGSGPSTPLYPTPTSSRTPNSTCPPTPGTDVKSTDSPLQRQLSGLGRHLDVDGLTTFCDPVQQRMQQIQAEYEREIAMLRSYLTEVMALASCNGGVRCAVEAKDDFFCPGSPGDGELNSLGNCSNAASDSSWEHLDEKDSRLTRWVPDHVVTHCARCEREFWIGRRKHHCRNCGNVFCNECTNHYIPIPQQHLSEPERVCHGCFKNLCQQEPVPYSLDSRVIDERPIAAAAPN